MKKGALITMAIILIALICYMLYLSGKTEGADARQHTIEKSRDR